MVVHPSSTRREVGLLVPGSRCPQAGGLSQFAMGGASPRGLSRRAGDSPPYLRWVR